MPSIHPLIRNAAAGLGGLGLVVAAVSNLEKIVVLGYTQFWTLLIVSWVLLIAAIWPQGRAARIGFGPPAAPRRWTASFSKFQWVIALTVLFAAAGIWNHQTTRNPREKLKRGEKVIEPATHIPAGALRSPHAPVYFANSTPGVFRAEVASTAPGALPPRVISIGLSTRKTSYVEEVDSHWGSPNFHLPDRFETDLNFGESPERWSGCATYRNDGRLPAAFRRVVSDQNRTQLLRYISDAASLERLVRNRAAVIRQIIPQGREWTEIRRASDRDLILAWLKDCVGLSQPVLLVTLLNPDPRPLAVTAVRYIMVGADVVCGPPPEPPAGITATEAYPHPLTLDWGAQRTHTYRLQTNYARAIAANYDERWGYNPQQGTVRTVAPQRFTLSPNFGLGPNQQGAFELHLYSRGVETTLWPVFLALELETSGGRVQTPEFWLEYPLDGTC